MHCTKCKIDKKYEEQQEYVCELRTSNLAI